jgi:type III pantothenate kinase
MNSPVEKIWLDGGNAKILGQIMMQFDIPSSVSVETIEGLVLRGSWAWLLENL